ncbi:MAG: sulfur carrier protein ThiS adenylyltransferase ThiF [Candidatus Cloacimonetes bacterium]|nr:sulfur carrier protein ThiS adenylyltransferase ThiF [Candidatus Cloacimonadota bacterium]
MIDPFFAGHDPQLRQIWQAATIGIAGAGGLGSNIAISLTRAGIGKLVIADFDVVRLTNLNRQQFFRDQVGMPKIAALAQNLSRISQHTLLEPHNIRITPDNLDALFRRCDILIEAFDLADQKQMLIEAWQSRYPDRPIIAASGVAGFGNNNALRQIQSGNLYLLGDGVSELTPGISPIAPKVAAIANMQANLCLELLVNCRDVWPKRPSENHQGVVKETQEDK